MLKQCEKVIINTSLALFPGLALIKLATGAMWDDLPEPFMVGPIKLWPAHSRPGMQWFLVWDGKPFYFRNKNEAILFAKDRLTTESDENGD